jgi:hypothetical protein
MNLGTMSTLTPSRTFAKRSLALLIFAMLGVVACSSETVVVRSPPPCAGGVWIPGHYGPAGYWRPAHWRCPGVVEVVE